MTYAHVPASWYADPDGRGGLRYWDGTTWTEHRVPPPPPLPPFGLWGPPPWKGAQLGRPANGPGALADPGRRFGARMLDVLVLLPVFALLLTVTLLIAAPHFGPLFPTAHYTGYPGPDETTTIPFPGIFWVELTVFGTVLATGLVMVAYETVATARYGRTLGKAWLHIRPVRIDGSTLGWGRAFGRVVIYWLFGFVSWFGALDPLWCLWDDKRQCLHDKVAGSIVINDLEPSTAGAGHSSTPAPIGSDAPDPHGESERAASGL
jgi:uncharacterized RDD family membrane protein YckC